LKLDLKKYYDCTNWDYLRLMLIQCGFGHRMTKWIMGCVTSASMAILINGEATNFINKWERYSFRGARYLLFYFYLVMEGLSLSLKKSQLEGKLTGIKVSRLVRILHLLFVDDVIIMSNASIVEWKEIHTLLNAFFVASGLDININKSTFHHFGVQQDLLNQLSALYHYGVMSLLKGFKYLGYYLKIDSYKVVDWKWLLKKYEQRICHWCNRFLTLGGRYVLIKAVLESQTSILASVSTHSSFVLNQICMMTFSFLWSRKNHQLPIICVIGRL
jgi:hypothetical protein